MPFIVVRKKTRGFAGEKQPFYDYAHESAA
jgi:hypothetical protein